MDLKRLFITVLFSLGYAMMRFIMVPGIEPISLMLLLLPRTVWRIVPYSVIIAGVILYDALTFGCGIWTVGVMVAYLIIGVLWNRWFHTINSLHAMLRANALMILVFDVLTGLLIGPIFFSQPCMEAVLGQIPFTVAHLIGNSFILIGYNLMIQMLRGLGYQQKQELDYETNNA